MHMFQCIFFNILVICFLSIHTMSSMNSISLESQLRRAALSGDATLCQQLIQGGAQVTSQGRNGFTALHIACQGGHYQVAQLLINAGASVHTPDDSGSFPLHIASAHGRLEVISLLSDRGANVNEQQASTYYSPLHIASNEGYDKVCEFLLNRGALVHAQSKDGNTALHCSCNAGHASVAALLMERGAFKDALNSDGRAPIHLAVMSNSISCCTALMSMKAKLDIQTSGSKKTALHIACLNSNTAIVNLLIQHGASLEIQSSEGETPLFAAVRMENTQMCKLLLQHGARKDVTDTHNLHLMNEVAANKKLSALFSSIKANHAPSQADRLADEKARYAQMPQKDKGIFIYQQVNVTPPQTETNQNRLLLPIAGQIQSHVQRSPFGRNIQLPSRPSRTIHQEAANKNVAQSIKSPEHSARPTAAPQVNSPEKSHDVEASQRTPNQQTIVPMYDSVPRDNARRGTRTSQKYEPIQQNAAVHPAGEEEDSDSDESKYSSTYGTNLVTE